MCGVSKVLKYDLLLTQIKLQSMTMPISRGEELKEKAMEAEKEEETKSVKQSTVQ
jgi:hypothetical protein